MGDRRSSLYCWHTSFMLEKTIFTLFALCITCCLSTTLTACEICLCFRDKNNTFEVDCNERSVGFVPSGIPTATKLLFLENNNLSALNGSLRPLINLEKLDLSNNPLCKIRSSDFQGLHSLKYLDLRNFDDCMASKVLTGNFLPMPRRLLGLTLFSDYMYCYMEQPCLTNVALTKMINLQYLNIDSRYLPFPRTMNLVKLKSLVVTFLCRSIKLNVLSDNFFLGIPNIEILSLDYDIGSESAPVSISKRILVPLRLLRRVELNTLYPDTTEDLFKALALSSSVRSLRVYGLQYSVDLHFGDYIELFPLLNTTTVSDLMLDRNGIQNWGFMIYLPKNITTLSVARNILCFNDLFDVFNNYDVRVEVLDASKQIYNCLSSETRRNMYEPAKIPTLRQLYFSYSSCSLEEDTSYRLLLNQYLLPHLTTLKLAGGNVSLISNQFHSMFPVVDHIDLSNSKLHFTKTFAFSSHLKVLNLEGSNIRTGITPYLFKNCTRLIDLNMARWGSTSLSSDFLRSFPNLKSFNFSLNLLKSFGMRLNNLPKLATLDLSYSNINFIEEETIDDLESLSSSSPPGLVVNLTGNPFICSCNALKLLKLLRLSKYLFFMKENYICQFTNGTKKRIGNLDWLPEMELECKSYTGLIVGVTSAILVFLSAITVGIMYRFRWKLRYIYYMAKLALPKRECQDGYRQVFEFDAFISYQDEDYKIVRYGMIRKLESEEGFRLCVHQRDFRAGESVACNISRAIHNSRRTIILLTQKYLKSKWCMYELNMARMEDVYSDRNVIIIVLVEAIPASQMPLDVLDLIRSKTYLEYPSEEDQIPETFWNKLKECVSDN